MTIECTRRGLVAGGLAASTGLGAAGSATAAQEGTTSEDPGTTTGSGGESSLVRTLAPGLLLVPPAIAAIIIWYKQIRDSGGS